MDATVGANCAAPSRFTLTTNYTNKVVDIQQKLCMHLLPVGVVAVPVVVDIGVDDVSVHVHLAENIRIRPSEQRGGP